MTITSVSKDGRHLPDVTRKGIARLEVKAASLVA